MRSVLVRASRRLLGPEAVIALLGLGSLTLGGCMPPVRSQFGDARLAPALYDAQPNDANGSDDTTALAAMPSDGTAPNAMQSDAPNQSAAPPVSAAQRPDAEPCGVIPPLPDE